MEVSKVSFFFFYFQNLKTELKNLVSTKSYGSLKMVCRFLIFLQKMLLQAKLCEPGNWYIFEKLLCCTTILPNFMFLVYPYPEIWVAGKNDPPGHTKTLNRLGLRGLKVFKEWRPPRCYIKCSQAGYYPCNRYAWLSTKSK